MTARWAGRNSAPMMPSSLPPAAGHSRTADRAARRPGPLIIPVGDQHVQVLQFLEKKEGKVEITNLAGVRFVDLVGEYGWNK